MRHAKHPAGNAPTSTARRPERVVVLALDGVYPFELGIPSRILGAADGRYEVLTCTVDGRPVRTSADFSITADHGPEVLETADTVVVAAMPPDRIPAELSGPVAAALARIPEHARVVSICTGAFVLAAAGLLDGRRATTHWAVSERFRRAFPRVALDPDVLFVEDGRFLTSAGAASGVDICLHLVRTDHGSALANFVARCCVVPPFRDGGQAQYVEAPVPILRRAGTDSLAALVDWMVQHLHEELAVDDLARKAHMSPRTFARRFREATGVTPAKWVLAQRVGLAQQLLEQGLRVEQVARRSGFGSAATLRTAFARERGTSPSAYARCFSGQSA